MDSYLEIELGYFRFYQLRNKEGKGRCCKLPSDRVNKLSFTLVNIQCHLQSVKIVKNMSSFI
jgi:hypothetical protein